MANGFSVTNPALLLLSFLRATVIEAQKCGEGPEQNSCHLHWSSLWYVWLILLTVFLLLICGVMISCIKCCKRSKLQNPSFANRSCEVTVIAIDNDHTISQNSLLQYISAGRNHVQDTAQCMLPPPPYSLCAIDNPPTYEMALKMENPSEIPEPKSGLENLNGNGAPIPERNEGAGSVVLTYSVLSQQ
ncbi:transmembrane protein 52-like [Hypanus sabinus]|uniref:transmembrane protein 52-like n=1 Tax=Hypanus sabinus TaxID=79690 RepID=UPI0028C37E9A|nr:transmembrane protein 52-like [Hypanus sabinus]